jgi:hypothetical protein
VSVTVPTRPRTRQNTTLRAGRSRVGRAWDPVTVSVSNGVVHARSRHSSTTAPSNDGGEIQRNVGRNWVTSPREMGATGRGLASVTTHVLPTNRCPARHAHTPDSHDCTVPHTRAHVPQCVVLLVRSVSQPLAATPSQSPQPLAQTDPHVPATQVATERVGTGHRIAHEPQC